MGSSPYEGAILRQEREVEPSPCSSDHLPLEYLPGFLPRYKQAFPPEADLSRELSGQCSPSQIDFSAGGCFSAELNCSALSGWNSLFHLSCLQPEADFFPTVRNCPKRFFSEERNFPIGIPQFNRKIVSRDRSFRRQLK